ncbi:MAG TPA: POT family MFS transporter [Verrucomicrobiae bacterium]|jgi:POT family proton-dependent oligopeptide transporter|nr:POT family MFS transporter [Verrucomicrobiae bacterium]
MNVPTTAMKTAAADQMPRGVPYIIGSEAAERFSYYGMNSILVVFMTHYLLNAGGAADHMTPEQAETWYHTFVSAAYFLPIVGAILADAFIGKFWTIFSLSLFYCVGHGVLALDHTRRGLAAGLLFIALGAGGIKPCVSAFVGDQFTTANQHLLTRVFSWFYFSINIGSAVSTLLIPWLLEHEGPGIAFGIPGVLMAIATVIIWLGRKKFVHPPSAGFSRYLDELFTRDTLRALGNLLIPLPFVAMFWALWQQNFSSWVVQAEKMDRHLFGQEWLPAQIQTVNPIFILLMLPLFSYVVYPQLNKIFKLTPLRKIGIGLFVTVLAFSMVALIQQRIDAGQKPNIIWQLLAFVILSAGEIMVSVTHLEFAYTQAPARFKSLAMCTYLWAISLGNVFTALVDHLIQNADGTVRLQGAAYFYFFVKMLLGTAVLFVFVAPFYRGRTYAQEQRLVD